MKNIYLKILVYSFCIFFTSCLILPSLPDEPEILKSRNFDKSNLDEAVKIEHELFKYANLLNAWLIVSEQKVKAKYGDDVDFPKYKQLNNLEFNDDLSLNRVMKKIVYYMDYILHARPIAVKVYETYGKPKDLRIK